MSVGSPAFIELDHSGDVGIEAWGATRTELLENATRGLFGLMARAGVEPAIERPLDVRAGDPAGVVVEWLSAVILLAATHGEVYGGVRVDEADERSARGVVRGERVDEAVHELRFDVKAATYHGLVLEERDGGFHCRVVFDL